MMPDDLPCIIYYRLQAKFKNRTATTVLTALPQRKVESIASSGATNAAIVRPTIPHLADGWREHPEHPWRPMSEIPRHWLPFLQRS